jgi:hypothetical protein
LSLSFARACGFDFSLDVFFGFKIWLIFFLIYFIAELFKNKKTVEQAVNQYFKEKSLEQKKPFPLLIVINLFFKYFFLIICFIGIYFEIFLSSGSSDFLFLSMIILWLLVAKKFSFNSQISAGVAIFFLALTPIYLISGAEMLAEKTANWAYMFLVATVIQLWRENKSKSTEEIPVLSIEKTKKYLLKAGEFLLEIDS